MSQIGGKSEDTILIYHPYIQHMTQIMWGMLSKKGQTAHSMAIQVIQLIPCHSQPSCLWAVSNHKAKYDGQILQDV